MQIKNACFYARILFCSRLFYFIRSHALRQLCDRKNIWVYICPAVTAYREYDIDQIWRFIFQNMQNYIIPLLDNGEHVSAECSAGFVVSGLNLRYFL